MAKGLSFDNSYLKLIFNATNLPLIADNTATTPLTSLYVALHSADPTSSGAQNTTEIAYTGYTRVAVARTTGGWIVTANSVSPAANIVFPLGTGGSGTATNFSVGTLLTGAGTILYTGAISPSINCGSGVTPVLTTASTITET